MMMDVATRRGLDARARTAIDDGWCASLREYHPDKLRQRGETMTAEKQAKFTRMKDAYEVCGAVARGPCGEDDPARASLTHARRDVRARTHTHTHTHTPSCVVASDLGNGAREPRTAVALESRSGRGAPHRALRRARPARPSVRGAARSR